MRDIFRLTTVLVVISVIAAALLAFTFSKTRGAIEQQQERTQQEALADVLPQGSSVLGYRGTGNQPSQYWVGIIEEDTVGYAFQISNRGYSGEITAMVGVRPDGTIIGLTILQQSETPGLGTRVQETVSQRSIWTGLFRPAEMLKPWFTEQFEGISILKPIGIDKSRGEWHALDEQTRQELGKKNNISAITGATISTRAVSTGLESQAAAYFRAIRGAK